MITLIVVYYTVVFILLVVTTSSRGECPPDILAVISPESRVATLRVSLGDVVHRLKLPIGTYDYDVINIGNNCSLKVEIKGDYDDVSVYLRMSHSFLLNILITNSEEFTFFVYNTIPISCRLSVSYNISL